MRSRSSSIGTFNELRAYLRATRVWKIRYLRTLDSSKSLIAGYLGEMMGGYPAR
ncbi:hypothetical protein O9992_11840 [Vibrio lentus]|nr:hypothetical protein [Vibrio lentus]